MIQYINASLQQISAGIISVHSCVNEIDFARERGGGLSVDATRKRVLFNERRGPPVASIHFRSFGSLPGNADTAIPR